MTITSAPAQYSSAHDNIVYTVTQPTKTSDPVTYPNYKFIADVYVSGGLIARVKKVPNPATGVGVFDIQQIVHNYVASVFNPTLALLSQQSVNGEFSCSVQVIFGEEYSYVSYYNVLSDSVRIFYNSYNKNLTGNTSALVNKLSSFASNLMDKKYATLSTTYLLIPYFAVTAGTLNYTVITSDGVTQSGTLMVQALSMNTLNISPAVLNTLFAGLITGSTIWYKLTIGSNSVTTYLICEPRYTVYPVHFINQYGGFETKLFSKVSKTQIAVERKSFAKTEYTVDSAGVVSYFNSNNVYNEIDYVYASRFTERLTLNSDILTDAEYRWLYDLIVSPLVYVQTGLYHLPYKITDSSYDIKKVIVDDLTNLTITLTDSRQLNAQNR